MEHGPTKLSDTIVHGMLLRFRREIMDYYPMTEENSEPIDTRFCFAMGLIVATITEAILSVRDDRPIRLNSMGFKSAVLNNPKVLED